MFLLTVLQMMPSLNLEGCTGKLEVTDHRQSYPSALISLLPAMAILSPHAERTGHWTTGVVPASGKSPGVAQLNYAVSSSSESE